MASYKLSKAADADLDAILEYGILTHGEAQADRYFDGLIAKFESLGANPLLYAERLEIDPAVRVCPFGAHVIIYVVDSDDVLILRVRHGREDWL